MNRDAHGNIDAELESLRERRVVMIDVAAFEAAADVGRREGMVPRTSSDHERALADEKPGRMAMLADAARRYSWQPAPVDVRPVALEPPTDSTRRHAVRVLSMVHELHKAGYQRIRILPYLSASGWWRCEITPSDNVADDGYTFLDPNSSELIARYSSADDAEFFGWSQVRQLTARQLAARFLKAFPLIAERGAGRDWLFAGWLTDVLGRAEGGRTEDLLYLFADWDRGDAVLRDWQPPPPIRG